MKEEFYSYSQMALGVEVYFTRIGDFTWRGSDCEELVGVTSQKKLRSLLSTIVSCA